MKRAVLIIAMQCVAATTAWSAATADPAQWVPADALASVGVANVSDALSGYRSTELHRLLTSPAYRRVALSDDVLGAWATTFQNRLAGIVQTDNSSPSVPPNPFGGALAAYLAADGRTDRCDLSLTVVVGVKDANLMRSLYGVAIKRLELASAHELRRIRLYDVDVFTAPQTTSADAGPALDDHLFDPPQPGALLDAWANLVEQISGGERLPRVLAVCLTSDVLIVSTSVTEVERVLGLLAGDGAALAADARYQAFVAAHANAVVWFSANTEAILDLAERLGGADARQMQTSLGLNALRRVNAAVTLNTPPADARLDVEVGLEGQPEGLAALLSQANTPTQPAPACGQVLAAFAQIAVDPGVVLNAVESASRLTDPAAADMLRRAFELRRPDQADDAPQRTALEALRGPVSLTLTRPTSAAESPRLALSAPWRDRDAFEQFLLVSGVYTRSVRDALVGDILLPKMTLAVTPRDVLLTDADVWRTGGPTLVDLVGLPGVDQDAWARIVIDGSALCAAAATEPPQTPVAGRRFWDAALRPYYRQLGLPRAAIDGLVTSCVKRELDAAGDFSADFATALLGWLGVDATRPADIRSLASQFPTYVGVARCTNAGAEFSFVRLKARGH